MLLDGAGNIAKSPINKIWVQKNMERALFYQLFIFKLNYQHFKEVSQQPDAESKKWAIVPASSNAWTIIRIINEILHYIGVHAKYLDNMNLD